MRIFIKGGIWRNTEDEILKAAVMKYGKNQWARISSLLVRKSAKQCKARWYEWLDPSVKKIEWTREEEEKLLHLVKIMPTQWRTIAPIVGRTAAQCIEHYEYLLDAAQGRETIEDQNDPRRLRTGEYDLNTETRPARPDPIDMDEDEIEMLSEARARLANTKGKKAKRKAREKQLEEARRLAVLQKRRELKMAGVVLQQKIRKKNRKRLPMNYSVEIPFERQVPSGLYETSEEERKANKTDFIGKSLDELDGRKREKREVKKDPTEETVQRQSSEQIAQMLQNESRKSLLRKRTKFSIPEAQINDENLEQIAKLTNKKIISNLTENGDMSSEKQATTSALLSVFAQTPDVQSAQRTPLFPLNSAKTPLVEDILRTEAENIIALTNAQTPLLGGSNAPLHSSDFTGVLPKSNPLQTPNVLVSSLANQTPYRSPAFNSLDSNLNPNPNSQLPFSSLDPQNVDNIRFELRNSLKNLPQPVNEISIILPDISEENKNEENQNLNEEKFNYTSAFIEDARDVQLRNQLKTQNKKNLLLHNRSSVLKKNLPRPRFPNPHIKSIYSQNKTINHSLHHLIQYEQKNFPSPSNEIVPNFVFDPNSVFDPEKIQQAQVEIQKETQVLDPNHFFDLFDQILSDFVFLPSLKKFSSFSQASLIDQIQALKQEFELLRKFYLDKEKYLLKKQAKIQILTKGYYSRMEKIIYELQDLHNKLQKSILEKDILENLFSVEQKSLVSRKTKIFEELSYQKQLQTDLQLQYQTLLNKKIEIQKKNN
ncbi:cell division cycle 5-like protein [Anaeramoeba ignava]|uniref:Cell division cycle 5-like protein n=1 Tax=Anaeramoeba ignava TaxID=1746090 RepID=A0A9Q0LGS9_ANAIG|nr:cell division cycle 5-like protein [Anaeramoeba ignava]